ncbi:RING-H2 finger protein ATL47 [Spatholobus suberectus]|nr:RING-H2 finger protein ATL47 [Spatholobus suberectus]
MTIIITVVLIFVGFVFLILLHVCISERLSRRGSSVERGANGGRSMSINDLEKLPCYDYVAKDNTSSPEDCAVCLENLITGDKCRLLPMCKHSFHAQCVDTWLLKTSICPICRCNAHSHSGNKVMSNNDCFIEPNSGSRESQTAAGSQLHDNMVQLRESQENGPSINVDIENPPLGSHNLVREE